MYDSLRQTHNAERDAGTDYNKKMKYYGDSITTWTTSRKFNEMEQICQFQVILSSHAQHTEEMRQ